MPFIIIDHGHPAIANYQHNIPKGTASVTKSAAAKKVSKHTKNEENQTSVLRENPYATSSFKPQKIYLAKELMSKPVIFLDNQQATLEQAWELMQQHHIKHLPIIQNKKLFGIISERDVLHALAFKVLKKENWLVKKVYAATKDTDIHQLTHTMFDEHIGSMPIVDDKQALIGIITRSDILKLISRYGPMEFWA